MFCYTSIETNIIRMAIGCADLRFYVATEKQIIYT